jgi:hypothetical protein
MKFKQYLTEGIESLEHWDQIKTFPPESLDNIKFIFDELRTKFKKVSEEIELPKDDETLGKLLVGFSDGICKVDFHIGVSKKKDSEEFDHSFLMVSGQVEKKHLLDVKDSRNALTYFSLFRSENKAECEKKMEIFKEALDKFTTWYFDLTQEYGRVKLFRTFYDVLEGSHDSNKPRFIALAGDFQVTEEIGIKTMRMDGRVL